MMYLNMNKTKEVDENMVRHMILNSIRMYRNMFNEEFGEIVLTYDSKHYLNESLFDMVKSTLIKPNNSLVAFSDNS